MEPTHVYTGTTACGCTVFVLVDRDSHHKDTAQEVAQAIRDGLTIQRITLEDYQSVQLTRCRHKAAGRYSAQRR